MMTLKRKRSRWTGDLFARLCWPGESVEDGGDKNPDLIVLCIVEAQRELQRTQQDFWIGPEGTVQGSPGPSKLNEEGSSKLDVAEDSVSAGLGHGFWRNSCETS